MKNPYDVVLRPRITERTVKHHLTAIFDRLGTTRRAEAVSRAVEQGLIRLPRR